MWVRRGSRAFARVLAYSVRAEAADGISQASSEFSVDQWTSTSVAIEPYDSMYAWAAPLDWKQVTASVAARGTVPAAAAAVATRAAMEAALIVRIFIDPSLRPFRSADSRGNY